MDPPFNDRERHHVSPTAVDFEGCSIELLRILNLGIIAGFAGEEIFKLYQALPGKEHK
ncbi:hypothetical protein BDW60DRAFT_183906 [Aspergillus nidulans var. acristatus]